MPNTDQIWTAIQIYCSTTTGLLLVFLVGDAFSPCLSALAPPSERDDKGVQVEAQDLGYETSGRSETEVEGSSTGRQGKNTSF